VKDNVQQTPEVTLKSWVMIAVLGLTWGGTFLVIELALEGITPFWLAAARISFGAALTGVIWAARGAHLFTHSPTRAQKTNLVVIALLSSAVPFVLLSWGQQFVTSGFAGVSMASVALMVLPLAHFLVPGERMTWRRLSGFTIGFGGVAMLVGAQGFQTSGALLELPGRLACLAAAACYAISSVQMRRLPPVDPVGLSAILLAIGTVFVIPVAWIAEGPPPLPDGQTLMWVAFLGLVPTAAANLLRVTLVRSAGPVFMSLVNYQVPLWSVLLGAWILSESLPPSLIWAMALILTGMAISQWGSLRRIWRGR